MFYNFSNKIINHVLSPPTTLPHLSTHLNSNSPSPKTKENKLNTKHTHTYNQIKVHRVHLDICTRVWLKYQLSCHWRKLIYPSLRRYQMQIASLLRMGLLFTSISFPGLNLVSSWQQHHCFTWTSALLRQENSVTLELFTPRDTVYW